MAHTCPECGMLCYCQGDIDDIDFGENWNCNCSLQNQNCNGYEDNIDDDEYWEENADS